MPAGTEVRCPLDGVVHSVADHAGLGDYGPTVILEHTVESVTFYTLYGHLSRVSLQGLTEGQTRHKGEVFATLGSQKKTVAGLRISITNSLLISWGFKAIFLG